MMPMFKCLRDCCDLYIEPYIHTPIPVLNKRKMKKAGVFIFDPKENKVLMVQSRGHLWGLPKGTLNIGENERRCAIREAKEETGIDVYNSQFKKAIKIKDKAIYFYLEMDSKIPVKVQSHIPNNDANGIAWLKIDCLKELLINGNLAVNNHCRVAFQKFLNQELPEVPQFDVVQ